MLKSSLSKHLVQFLLVISILLFFAVVSQVFPVVAQSSSQTSIPLADNMIVLPVILRGDGSATPEPAQLLLSEVLADPIGNEPAGEWVELYNAGGTALDLANHKLGDAETTGSGTEGMFIFPTGASIGPKQVLVVADDAAEFQANHGFKPDYEITGSDPDVPNLIPYETWATGNFALTNSGDEVLILDENNDPVDSISWGDSTFGSPAPQVAEGHSLERYPPDQDTNDPADWREQEVPEPSYVTAASVSLVGVHYYSGDSSMLDAGLPLGQRGWNVEFVQVVEHCNGDLGGIRGNAQAALNDGLVNIIRIDYKTEPIPGDPENVRQVAVPRSSKGEDYTSWANSFVACINKLSDLSNIFIVGNEPNIDGEVTAQEYIDAFNALWPQKPGGIHLLAAFNSPYTEPGWMATVSAGLTGVNGFAIHTGGRRPNPPIQCLDPRQPCPWGGWWFDGGFRFYRDVIRQITPQYRGRPVYITEFNTYTGTAGEEPIRNYEAGWVQKAFEDIRDWNATEGQNGYSQVLAMCWFTDRVSWPWGDWALRNISQARDDMSSEFHNPANHGGTQPPTPTPTPPPSQNDANILEGSSTVPTNMNAGTTQQVTVQVQNTGNTTWSAGANFRLGAYPFGGAYPNNQVTWSGWDNPGCGGYANSPTDARIFLCHDVPPDGTHDFIFNITVPAGASGTVYLSVQMVKDGDPSVGWFGEVHPFPIQVGSSTPTPPTPTPPTPTSTTPPPTTADLYITNPDASIVPGLWFTHCISDGTQERVWRIDTTDTHWAQYQYTQSQTPGNCGTPDPVFGGYPMKITANPGPITAGIWITWCTGVNHDEWVWRTDGTTHAPFQYPQTNPSCP